MPTDGNIQEVSKGSADTDSPSLETASSGEKPAPEDIRTHLGAEDATINSTITKHDAVTKATILKPSPSQPDGNYDIDALLIRRFDTPVYGPDGSVEIVTTELPRLRYGILEKEKRFRRYFAECIQKPGGMDPFEAEALANQRVREERASTDVIIAPEDVIFKSLEELKLRSQGPQQQTAYPGYFTATRTRKNLGQHVLTSEAIAPRVIPVTTLYEKASALLCTSARRDQDPAG
ncbi:hypothetical protein BS50DRAFT_633404 [Corynespora cassiicola Philippines]|uniref:Uncharacterized protein n=1 Tax=Corynespora cassiicola Philippines TaxID=1448308 RepID=A0A2T2NQK7_CORCC|nr:hypothetical protein BS50DRAFT_633404 [Corynespora cassiicola Philippines]